MRPWGSEGGPGKALPGGGRGSGSWASEQRAGGKGQVGSGEVGLDSEGRWVSVMLGFSSEGDEKPGKALNR